MDNNFDDFVKSLGTDFLTNLSEQVTKEFSDNNNLENNAIPTNQFVTFANYSSIRTSMILLEKYHSWLKDK